MPTYHQLEVQTARTNLACYRTLARLWWQADKPAPDEVWRLIVACQRRLIELKVPSNRWE